MQDIQIILATVIIGYWANDRREEITWFFEDNVIAPAHAIIAILLRK